MRYLFVGIIYTVIWWSPAWCSGNDDSWRLSTDDTTMVVGVQKGMPVITQLGSSRTQSNWLAAPMPEKLLPSIMQGGVAVAADWKYVGGSYDDASGKLVWSPVGTGFIDWAAQFSALASIGYSDAVNLETHWKGPGTPEDSSRTSWAGMKKALQKANA